MKKLLLNIEKKLWILFEFFEKLFPSESVIQQIVLRQSINKNLSFAFDGLTFKLEEGSFNPEEGAISRKFIEVVAEQLSARQEIRVLDIGTGCGFYAIYLSKKYGFYCHGTDINSRSIELAKTNAVLNNVEHLTKFILNEDASNLFTCLNTDYKYDVIIGNLPFSSIRKTYRSKKSIYYEAFAGRRFFIEQLLLQSPNFLRPNGIVFFTFGDSGYTSLYEKVLKISKWKANLLWTQQGNFDFLKIIKLQSKFKN